MANTSDIGSEKGEDVAKVNKGKWVQLIIAAVTILISVGSAYFSWNVEEPSEAEKQQAVEKAEIKRKAYLADKYANRRFVENIYCTVVKGDECLEEVDVTYDFSDQTIHFLLYRPTAITDASQHMLNKWVRYSDLTDDQDKQQYIEYCNYSGRYKCPE